MAENEILLHPWQANMLVNKILNEKRTEMKPWPPKKKHFDTVPTDDIRFCLQELEEAYRACFWCYSWPSDLRKNFQTSWLLMCCLRQVYDKLLGSHPVLHSSWMIWSSCMDSPSFVDPLGISPQTYMQKIETFRRSIWIILSCKEQQSTCPVRKFSFC